MKTHNRSRSLLSLVNILSGFANRFLTSVLKLAGRIVFFRFLSAELYGVSSLFSNVLGLLSLTELGIGTAITFSLYRPLAEKDEEKVRTLMEFFRKAYLAIAVTVLVLGLGLMPFLPHLIRDYRGIEFFYLIYLLFLANMVIDYLFSYKRTLAVAMQEGYCLVPFTTVFEAVICIGQIAVILLFSSSRYCYLVYLAVQMLCLFLQNVVINRYLDRRYPLLTRRGPTLPLPDEEKKGILKNVKALMFHKIGGVVVTSTDSLLISKLVDLVTVGVYSNYSSIIATVSGLVYLFVGNTTASFGNLVAKESPEKRRAVFEELQFFYFALYGVCTALFVTLFQPFISLSYGKDFTLPLPVVILVVCANFYYLGLSYVLDVVKSAAGIYVQDRFVPLWQAGINLAVSLILGIRIGLAGIFVGTLVSTLFILILRPLYVYRNVFESSPLPYYISLVYQSLVVAATCGISLWACRLVPAFSLWVQLVCHFLITLSISVLLFLLFNFRSPYFAGLLARFRNLFRRAR
ncbi:MAG: oligosaccharide flippase family protein [Clostridia bacterium]|nr:oligosaccharide flippase family protein [Clostridia bacterium]